LKLFINLCYNDYLPEISEQTQKELDKQIQRNKRLKNGDDDNELFNDKDGEETIDISTDELRKSLGGTGNPDDVLGIRFPLSVGEPRPDTDKGLVISLLLFQLSHYLS
jgi:hypothetical protein